MKYTVIVLLIVLFAVVSCDSADKIKEAGQDIGKKIEKEGKKVAQTAQDKAIEGTKQIKKEMSKPELNREDVFVYFNELKKASQKYPDIDFYSATTAAIQAGTQGLNLKDIIERETELTFKKYQTTGIQILNAMTESQGLVMQEDMLNSMKEGRKNAKEQVNMEELSEEEKKEFLNQMEQLNKTIEETEKELQSENAERIRKNMQIIEEAKEKAGIE